MKTIYELQQIANRLRQVMEVNSISPEDTFGLQSDVLEYLADMEQNAEGLGIHKVYASYAAMVADASSPVGSNGKALRFGQLVVICNPSNTIQEENGNIYAWQKGNAGDAAWLLIGNLGSVLGNPQNGYYVCDTAAATAEKEISATSYVLSVGGSMKVKMTNANTADNATLNINSTGVKALYYAGERASSINTWEAGETVEVYYDGTSYYANNVAGGSGSGDGAFDVSAKYPTSGVDGSNTYTLGGALAVLNANLSANKKKGGMSIKFIQSSDNKYAQYRLTADEWSTDTENWAIAEEGVYVENTEFIYVKTDAEDKILWAIKVDGSIYYGAGVPPQIIDYVNEKIAELSLDEYEDIVAFLNGLEEGDKTLQELLDEKVDKEEGKSLIDAEYADGVHYIENPEFVKVVTDNEDRILYAVKADGDFYFGAGVPQQVVDYINERIGNFSSDEYEDIIAFLNGLEEGDKTLQQLLDEKVDTEIGKSLIDSQFAESQSVIENSEFMRIETDSEGKILSGRRKNGRAFENLGIETQNCILSDDSVDTSNDPEDRISLLLDIDNKVISYRKKDGLLRENVGLSTPHVDTEEIILSKEGIKDFLKSINKENILTNSTWIGNNIWWCGTSIPAGASKNTKNERSYPRIVGEMLGVNKMYNEAVGSSCARRISNISGRTYESVGRMMGSTIEDALSIFADLWTINDIEHTVTVGPRTMGITAIPNISTYADACYQRYFLLSNSYEIKLISKYLISDTIENESFLREKFGNLYNTLISLNPNDYNYQGDVDLFIIDHGHNDSPTPVSSEYVDSTDITTYIGAINTYINLIWSYKPKARIMFVSDYDNFTLSTQTIQAQQQIAEHWHIPFIDLRKHLPFNINTKVKVRGYWATDGFWHKTGFTYNPNASTVSEAFSVNGDAEFNYLLGNTISEIAENITPEQDENGVWWYYLSPRDVWIKDAVHPSSDKSNKALQLYAKVLSEFIIQN